MTTGTRLTWVLDGGGWATCTIEDHQARAELSVSYITDAPEDLLTAVARLVSVEGKARVQFEAEPTAYRWILHRQADDVRIRVLELSRGSDHDSKGTEIWSGRLGIDALGRAVIRCFEEVARTYGESGYLDTWRRPFPRSELEALRRLWRAHRSDAT